MSWFDKIEEIKQKTKTTAKKLKESAVEYVWDENQQIDSPANEELPTYNDVLEIDRVTLERELKESDFEDPLSHTIMEDAIITPCGHNFSLKTIHEHLKGEQVCPICSQILTLDMLKPDKVLNEKIYMYWETIYSVQEEDSNLNEEELKAVRESRRQFDKLVKPRICIIGETGSGKSSLVNKIFNCDLAQVGYGRPVTQWTKKWTDKNYKVPIILYDTKGIELGDKEFIDLHGRFQDFEIEVCQQVLKSVEQVATMKKALHDSDINIQAIFTVSNLNDSQYYSKPLKTDEVCCFCSSSDTSYRATTQEWNCSHCKESWTANFIPNQIVDLVEFTSSILPDVAQQAFCEAQTVSESLKTYAILSIILSAVTSTSAVAASPIPFVSSIFIIPPIQTAMFMGIARVASVPIHKYPKILAAYSSMETLAGLTGLGLGNVIKLVPGFGTVVGGAMNAGIAAAMTSSLGVAYSLGLHEIKETYPDLENDDVSSSDLSKIIGKYLNPAYQKKLILAFKNSDLETFKEKIFFLLSEPPNFDEETEKIENLEEENQKEVEME